MFDTLSNTGQAGKWGADSLNLLDISPKTASVFQVLIFV